MKTTLSIFKLLSIGLVFALILGACTSAGNGSPPTAPPAAAIKLRIAVLPILDTLPMYVAQQEGLFAANNVIVEFIPVASAAERDQIITAGQADGMINEPLSTMLYNKNGVQVQTVRYARAATPQVSLFRILAAGNSGIQAVGDLRGVEIGISQGTVIEYLSDRLLRAEGLTPDEIKFIAVPKIPDRMTLLGTGELKAAMLPEPSASLAIQQGARLILDDTRHPEFSYSTITFRKAIIDQHPQAIQAFMEAIEQATSLINADPAKWSTLLSDQKLVPPSIIGTFEVPPFVTAGVPTPAQWDDALAWARQKGLLDRDLAYADSVVGIFLP
ncbi:MAG: ABC transporter substrate-binding protein [Chloroflexota bacterium]